MDYRRALGGQKAPQQQLAQHQQQQIIEESEPANYVDSALEKEIKQRAATALHDHSVLLIRALSMNETPAKARLRMYRHLTGQPQPLHDYTPTKRKHKETDNTNSNAAGASTLSFRPAGSSSSSSSAAVPGQASSRQRRDIIPVDDEFAFTSFQGLIPASP
ncbi:hypothetical protein BGZ99_005336 [Dissophora globulifera]|uniref:Uncharacterized protein n=1 Tax=Dissophora globulifera TaxID=979702 RepID=A0A9P6RK56_9FUNG|nr:hypothetical protein BGZ99_005336 [Dissophora globulifera]